MLPSDPPTSPDAITPDDLTLSPPTQRRIANPPIRRSRILRLLRWPLAILSICAILAVGLDWLSVFYQQLAPRWLPSLILLRLSQALRALHASLFLIAPTLILTTILLILFRRRSPGRNRFAFRSLALGLSLIVSLLLLEAGLLLVRPLLRPEPRWVASFDPLSPGDERSIDVLVLGESSARGVPYDPILSVSQVVAWHIQKMHPETTVRVDMRAQGGFTLGMATAALSAVSRRPEIILLYSGHNEYQARFGWDRAPPYYLDDSTHSLWSDFQHALARRSAVASRLANVVEKRSVQLVPPPWAKPNLVDRPVCTPAENRYLLWEFQRDLEKLASYCQRIGALAIAIIPPGNLTGYPPYRSFLKASTTAASRSIFERAFREARQLETTDPSAALQAHLRLLEQQPTFAESHFRAAQLLESTGRITEARHHYIKARDLDGIPMRCTSSLEGIYRAVAAKYPNLILIDGPALLSQLSGSILPGDSIMHDPQHPTFRGYLAIAQEVLNRWALSGKARGQYLRGDPLIDPAACASHFLSRTDWARLCRRTCEYIAWTSWIRYDRSESLARANAYAAAEGQINRGVPPDQTGVPGLGVQPPGLPQ